MVHASETLDLIPSEAKPTGATLELPEHGIKIAVDSNELIASQEQAEGTDEIFIDMCEAVRALVHEHFSPKRVSSTWCGMKKYWGFGSPQAALKASLQTGTNAQDELARKFNMPPSHKRLDYSFASGSFEFHVVLEPVTFERVAIARLNAGFRATPEEKRRVERLNQKAQKAEAGKSRSGHAIMMDMNLVESDPPSDGSVRRNFDELQKRATAAAEAFTFK
jgi:CO/xanthine dehydrogenase Mo-binding subunit